MCEVGNIFICWGGEVRQRVALTLRGLNFFYVAAIFDLILPKKHHSEERVVFILDQCELMILRPKSKVNTSMLWTSFFLIRFEMFL